MIINEIIHLTQKRVSLLNDNYPVYKTKRISLIDSIRNCKGKNPIITEIKYSSPSSGILNSDFTPEELAGFYVNGGCTAISVLTEPNYFHGCNEFLIRVKSISECPVLRKDFIIDIRQLKESASIGADAVLVIASLVGERLSEFISIADKLGIELLIEVHSLEEAHKALNYGAKLIGVNNRNLATMKTDLSVTEEIGPFLLKQGAIVVAESGINSESDIRRLKGKCNAFLIGSSLMKSKTPQQLLEGFVFA